MLNVYAYKSNWWGYVSKRLLIAIIVFFVISLAVYFSIHGLWGIDNAVQILKSIPTIEPLPELERLINELSLNESRIVQYMHWMGGIITGDWGESILPESYYAE